MAPEPAPEADVPTMAPVAEEPALPVIDYFATQAAETAPEPAPALAPVEEPALVEEPVELHQIQPAFVPEPAALAELPAMAPPEPTLEPEPEPELVQEPAAFEAPQPVELSITPVDFELPVVEPLEASVPVADPDLSELFAAKSTEFRVVVRLKDSDGVEVGSFRDFGTAMEGAQEVIEQFSNAAEGQWPFYAGRFIRPDLIVSVDVVEGEDA
jgi:hypothetical protein